MNFSVIIPLYNKEKHIKRALDSLLQQTHQEFEVIVVDDGSTDSSYKEAISVNDPRIKVLRKNNGGVSAARNYGIKQSTFDFIGFLDADDEWKPSFLESVSKLINKYPEAGAYATSYEFKKDKKIKRANINIELADGKSGVVDYFKGTLKDPLISASSVVIKKSVFHDVGFFSRELTRGEDLEMWCRIAFKYHIVFFNEVLSTYFQDADNKITKTKQIYSTSFMSRVESILIEQKNLGNNNFYFEEYMITRIMNKVSYLIGIRRNKEARKLLWKYKHTKYNKKKWLKNYILSFRPFYLLYQNIK
ncbi:glycosyltransferase family 2 protein [Virgibacillus sp. NKC19-16]|uniref:glycosyltransferase family 2 protein n=1 Tax=Virgibacillus salidurans TaxID=2831673 RepID=UPI001F27FC78|nr:glycosyltransferase family A protein [Virgibacillus sp. NKC19-16]UJL45810.1 glycosyltransferase family 2 protein [Virgibacillus sp. NKC19-16]